MTNDEIDEKVETGEGGAAEGGHYRLKVPEWLGNDDMREAIKNRLEWRGCREETDRLKMEISALQEWSQEEWAVYIVGQEMEWKERWEEKVIKRRRQDFIVTCANWQEQLRKV